MPYDTLTELPADLIDGLREHRLAPYLGPAMLGLCDGPRPPGGPLALAAALTSKNSEPGQNKNRLTAAAQFIENLKHRKTLVKGMDHAFATRALP